VSGKIEVPTNVYRSIDETVTDADGVVSCPFAITRLLDIVRNDGPGEASITLDGGGAIPLNVGDYIGPWENFHCSTITIQCVEEGKSCRIRALGV
jgi:hypothetical protein